MISSPVVLVSSFLLVLSRRLFAFACAGIIFCLSRNLLLTLLQRVNRCLIMREEGRF